MLVPMLPAASLCDASAVYVPAASAGLAAIVQAAPERVAVRVCTSEPPVVAPE